MARFASETRQKMREVTQMLGPRLGADTVGLDLRIGLHSGPGMYQPTDRFATWVSVAFFLPNVYAWTLLF